MDYASAAQNRPAAILCASKLDLFADHPKQRDVRRRTGFNGLPVDHKFGGHVVLPLSRYRLSPGFTVSPADLNHLVILPSATVSPSCGINKSIAQNSPG